MFHIAQVGETCIARRVIVAVGRRLKSKIRVQLITELAEALFGTCLELYWAAQILPEIYFCIFRTFCTFL